MSSDRFFIDSPVLREFSKTAMDKGWLKQEPIVKQAAAKVEVTGNLDNDLASLISHLQDRGMSKEAKAIEDKYLVFKGAQLAVNRLIDEEAKQLLMAAHPNGDTKVMEASNGWGVSHTGLSAQEKTLSILSASGIPRMASQNKKMIKKVAEALGMVSLADNEAHQLTPQEKKEIVETNKVLNRYKEKIVGTSGAIGQADWSDYDFWARGISFNSDENYAQLQSIYTKLGIPSNASIEQINSVGVKWVETNAVKDAESTSNIINGVNYTALYKKIESNSENDGELNSRWKDFARNVYKIELAKLVGNIPKYKKGFNDAQSVAANQNITSAVGSILKNSLPKEIQSILEGVNDWISSKSPAVEGLTGYITELNEFFGEMPPSVQGILEKIKSTVESIFDSAIDFLKKKVAGGEGVTSQQMQSLGSKFKQAASNLTTYLLSLPKEKKDKERANVTALANEYLREADKYLGSGDSYLAAAAFDKLSGGYNFAEVDQLADAILAETQNLSAPSKPNGIFAGVKLNELTKFALPPKPSEKGVGAGAPPASGPKPSGGGVVPNNYSSKPLTPDSQAIQRMQMLLNQFGLYLNRDQAKAKVEFPETYNPADANRIIMVGPNATHPADFDGNWGPNTTNALAATNKYLTAKKLSNVTTARGTGAQADANSEILRSLLDELKVSTGEPGAVKSIVYDKISTPVIMTDISGDGDVPVTNKDLSSLLAFYDFLLKKNVVTTVDPKAGIPARNFWVALAWFNARALAINSYAGKPMGNTVSDKNNFKNNSKSYYNATQSLIKDFNRWAKLNGLSSDEELDSTVIDRASIAAALPTSGMGSAKNPQGYALGPDGKPLLGPSGKPIRDSRMGFMPSSRNHGGDEFVESVEDEGDGTSSKTDMPIQKTINLSATGPDGAPWWDMSDTYNGFISIGRNGLLNKHAVIVAQTLFPGDVGDEYKLQQDWMRGAGYQNLGWNESAGSFMYLDRANNQRGLVINNPDFKKSRTYNTSSTSVAQYRAFLNRLGGQMGRVLQDWQTRMQPDAAAWENQSQAASVWNQVISRQLKQLQDFERKNR